MRRIRPAHDDTPVERTDDPQVICPATDRSEDVLSAVQAEITPFVFRTPRRDSKTPTEIAETLEMQVENSTHHLDKLEAAGRFTCSGPGKNGAGRRAVCSAVTPGTDSVSAGFASKTAIRRAVGTSAGMGEGR